MAVTAAIQLGWLGTHGLREIATRCAQGAHYLFEKLLELNGVESITDQPFFREFAVRLSQPASVVIERMAERDVLAGLALSDLCGDRDPSIEGPIDSVLLVTVTERRTKEEIDHYVDALKEVLS
jgi:glycine dehydrogenase subunit 1